MVAGSVTDFARGGESREETLRYVASGLGAHVDQSSNHRRRTAWGVTRALGRPKLPTHAAMSLDSPIGFRVGVSGRLVVVAGGQVVRSAGWAGLKQGRRWRGVVNTSLSDHSTQLVDPH